MLDTTVSERTLVSIRISPAVIIGAAAVLLGALVLIQWQTPLIVDEYYHVPHIDDIANGVFRHSTKLSMGSGYHAIVAAIARIAGVQGRLNAYRGISAGISLVCVLSFYLVICSLGRRFETTRLTQFVFLPILLPFFVLVYTDVLAIALLMLMIYFHLKGRILLSAAIGLAGLLVRQTNIVWIAAWFVVQFLVSYEHRLSWQTLVQNGTQYLKKQWLYVVVFLLFGAFFITNGGVALANQQDQSIAPNANNPLFYLALHGVLFLPLIVTSLPEAARRLRRPWAWLGLAGILLAYAFLTIKLHPWNQPDMPWHLVRNDALRWLESSTMAKIVGGLAIVLGYFSFLTTKLARPEYYAIYIFGLALMSVQYLIEPRYYLPFLALFILFRAGTRPRLESMLSIYWIALSCMMFFIRVSFNYLP